MKKAVIISKIKSIIKQYGEFTIADVEAVSSPVLFNTKHTQTVGEQFGLHKVTAVEYFKDEELNEDYYSYEQLTVATLKEILYLAEIHQENKEPEIKEEIKEVLINQIRADINHDWTVLDDLLDRLPLETLINALSDKEMNNYKKHLK